MIFKASIGETNIGSNSMVIKLDNYENILYGIRAICPLLVLHEYFFSFVVTPKCFHFYFQHFLHNNREDFDPKCVVHLFTIIYVTYVAFRYKPKLFQYISPKMQRYFLNHKKTTLNTYFHP
jgi:hypothetical protein